MKSKLRIALRNFFSPYNVEAVPHGISHEDAKAITEAVSEAAAIINTRIIPYLRCADNPQFIKSLQKTQEGFSGIIDALWLAKDVNLRET